MTDRITGRIIKGIGGFYYVRPIGSISLIETKPRGRFRHQKTVLTVGDYVEVIVNDGEATIEKIYPRKNIFVRPPVANVDIALIVFSGIDPKPDYYLIDKLLVLAEYHHVDPVLIITKCDLISSEEQNNIRKIYAPCRYPMFFIDKENNDFLEQLEAVFKPGDQSGGYTAFLAGQSGVGKSTLANRLCQGSRMATGLISEKSNRGKHTTRHVELLELSCGGYLLDTPGFSSLSLLRGEEDIALEDLCLYFPEFDLSQCKFNTCTHRTEPGCGIKSQLAKGEIHPQRYENYIRMFNDLKENIKF